jgi:sec-independent protein translocase protein TatC
MKKNINYNNFSSILKNLHELKIVIIKSFSIFIFFFIISFFNSNLILNFLSNSLINQLNEKDFEIVFIGLISPFSLKINISFIISFYISTPFFLYFFYKFIAPGLYKSEKKRIFPYIIFSPILFFIASLFVFFLILPNAQNFFLNLNSNINLDGKIKMLIDINQYLSMCFTLFFVFGVSFQFPLILKILLDFHIIQIELLKKIRKFVIVFIFIASAILTPPDIMSQIFLAVPLVLIYEIIIIFYNLKLKKIKKN